MPAASLTRAPCPGCQRRISGNGPKGGGRLRSHRCKHGNWCRASSSAPCCSLGAIDQAVAANIPPCAASMGCLCAGHARGAPASAACDTTERPARPDPAWAGVKMHRNATATIDRAEVAELQPFHEFAIEDAQRHGEESDDPDHEVGDLQGLVHACWKHLTPEGRRKVIEEVTPFMWTRPDPEVVDVRAITTTKERS